MVKLSLAKLCAKPREIYQNQVLNKTIGGLEKSVACTSGSRSNLKA